MSNFNNYTIANACNVPLNIQQGTIPNLSNVLNNWLQKVTFGKIIKTIIAGQVKETVENTVFQATIQPLKARELEMKPEGQRSWTWFKVIAKSAPGGDNVLVNLNTDDVGIWNGIQTRVMARTYNGIYGTLEMDWVQDWTGSGPPTP